MDDISADMIYLDDEDHTFANGGNVGQLMRAYDWASSPVGAVEDWPQSLRTAVSICLASQFPMLIWWGPEYVMLYNDAYAAILGEKHPRALGRPGFECWSEIWDVIGPMLDGVMRDGKATWSENLPLLIKRSGFMEESYFTFSYSPMRGEDGSIAGIFTAVTETTAQVVGARRMRGLRALAASTAEARTLQDVCEVAAHTLLEYSDDVPFSLLYLLSQDGAWVRLAAASHWPDDMRAPIAEYEIMDEERELWPFSQVQQQRRPLLLDDVAGRLAGVWGGGGLADAGLPEKALVLPVAQAGQAEPYGFLVAGINPRQVFDDDYRGFLTLLAGQVATACAAARAYQDAQERAEALAELDRAKTTFFHNISHEFRTPLTLALGPLEAVLADRTHLLTEEQRTHLEMVRRNELRQLKLVNTLLDFSRIEAGRIDAFYMPTDLAQLTRDLSSSFRSAIEKAHLWLQVDCEPLPEPIYVDREMWEKIVLNLISNAFKYTLRGGIHVSLRLEGADAVLMVQDSGIGISPEDQRHLFERFYRVRQVQARTQEGSGIGLSLVQELVRLHGGTISVTSQPGVGTTFTIRIPRGYLHLPTDRVEMERTLPPSSAIGALPYVEEVLRWLPEEQRRPAEIAPSLSTGALISTRHPVNDHEGRAPRLLVVDDNADMRDYLDHLLSPTYSVSLASNGYEALEVARAERPDMIISDVMMPGMDGFALLSTLHGDPATHNIPFLLLSARAGEEATLEGLLAGADDYLTKPFSARELLGRVQARLEIARLQREAESARQRLHDLFMQAPAVIAVLHGPEHVFILANPGYAQIVGRPAEDLLGKPIREALPELNGQGFIKLLDRVYRTGETFYGNEMLVRLDRQGNGELEDVYFNFVYQAAYDTTSSIDGILVHAVDVTEQVRARKRAEILLEALEEADRRKDEFLHMVSHELRTPITAIKGNIQLSQRRLKRLAADLQQSTLPSLDELRQMHSLLTQLLERAARQIETQKRLINDLLDVSRIQSGKLDLSLQTCDLTDLVREVVLDQRSSTPHRQIELLLEPGLESLAVMVDPGRIEQVVNNYLTNAIKYAPADKEITVGVEVVDRERQARVWVRDRGPGLNARQQQQIWERFYQDPDIPVQAGSGQGMGLGLHICQTIINMHNGRVGVESEPGHGATFWFTLPLLEAQ
ncbi:ATP-binding protein [Dictyobacter aurantiacus]|uniref:histidine kinase n=1 Tax=Dictyobacter aurantiacus TaxID=1936993 RepID=A0A401ZK81_9CHLR|nr:ATP-binding protein [Dictyobacter aurantiacus]GCE07265.1 hypothetical protein KDAU_45940 [Dictyobacter aurantiacus]